MLQHYSKLLFLISIILLCVTVYVSFIVGTIPISLDILTQFTTGHVSNVDTIIDLRLPRIIIALCVGAMLSVSGALLQAVLQNPLADATTRCFIRSTCHAYDSIIGDTPIIFVVPLLSFLGGMIPFLLLFLLSVKFKFQPTRMILIGVAMYAMLTV